METKFVRDFIEDLSLVLESDCERFIRYDQENNEVMTNLQGDSIYIFDMNDIDERTKLINYIIHYMSEHGKEFALKNRKINLEFR